MAFKQLLLFYQNPHIHWSNKKILSVSSPSVFQNLTSSVQLKKPVKLMY